MEAKRVTVSDQEKVKLLSDLIAIQSVNDHEQVVADYIANYFDRHGIRSTQVPVAPGRVNLVASIGSGYPTIVLSGHMDVVSPVESDRWQTDPFKLVEKDGRLYGRGTVVMKGGLVDMMVALVELKEKGEIHTSVLPLKPLRQVGVIRGTLEEVLSRGCQDYVTVILTDRADLDVLDMQDRLRQAFPNLLEIRREVLRKADYEKEFIPEKERDPFQLCCEFLKETDVEEQKILRDVINTVQSSMTQGKG